MASGRIDELYGEFQKDSRLVDATRTYAFTILRTMPDGAGVVTIGNDDALSDFVTRSMKQKAGSPDGEERILAGSVAEGCVLCRSLAGGQFEMEGDIMTVCHVIDTEDSNLTAMENHTGFYHVNTDCLSDVKRSFIDSNTLGGQLYNLKRDTSVENGPAFTLSQVMHWPVSIDFVPVVKLLFWPREARGWLQRDRRWPSISQVEIISQIPSFLVNKSPTGEVGTDSLYVSFNLAEQTLVRWRTEEMKFTYFVFKLLFYQHIKVESDDKEFGSYLVKTVMMWQVEEADPAVWTREKLPQNLTRLLRRLFDYLDLRFMPHYFIPELNLLATHPDSLYQLLEQRLDRQDLLDDPIKHIVIHDIRCDEFVAMWSPDDMLKLEELRSRFDSLKDLVTYMTNPGVVQRTMSMIGEVYSGQTDRKTADVFRECIIALCQDPDTAASDPETSDQDDQAGATSGPGNRDTLDLTGIMAAIQTINSTNSRHQFTSTQELVLSDTDSLD